MGLKEWRTKQREIAKEKRTFRGIVAKRTLAERRRAYEKEALKVAGEKGVALARRPSFGAQVGSFAARIGAPRKAVAVRRPIRRRIVYRRAPMRRRVARRKRYSYAPTRRVPRRRIVRRSVSPQQTQKPFDIGDLI